MKPVLPAVRARIELELARFAAEFSRESRRLGLPVRLDRVLSEFILRRGKRLRPLLFLCGFSGYARPVAGLYRTAISLELLHDFVLIHDDIIDGSPLRRGGPAMHIALGSCRTAGKNRMLAGRNLGIIVGDVLYALAISAFLSIQKQLAVKHCALSRLMKAAHYTGVGQIFELGSGFAQLPGMALRDVYRIYDLKTAHYSFVVPLTSGAILAGAPKTEVRSLGRCGLFLGRAFQIRDDLLEMANTASSSLADLQEGKVTLLIWYAFHRGGPAARKAIAGLIRKPSANEPELLRIRDVILDCGAAEFAQREMRKFAERADPAKTAGTMRHPWKSALLDLTQEILGP